MANAFLRQLLRAENRVQGGEERDCIICLEKCGTMNPRSGLTEYAIRLPLCHHIVGSGCIATWLRQSNTCPLCRRAFFSTRSSLHDDHDDSDHEVSDHGSSQSHPRREHGSVRPSPTVRREILNGPIAGITDYLTGLGLLCDGYCAQLNLQPDVAGFVASIAAKLLDSTFSDAAIQNHSDDQVVAVSMYVASILTGHPRSPSQISAVIQGVDWQFVMNYKDLADWKAIIDGDIRSQLSETFGIEELVRLN